MSIKGTKTEQNLLKSFAGESMARDKYKVFADKAKKEDFDVIAAYFDFAAGQEDRHAKVFFSYLEEGGIEVPSGLFPAVEIGNTTENLLNAVEGEHIKANMMYPEFARIAGEEGLKKISVVFKMLSEIEKKHEEKFRLFLKNEKEVKTINPSDKKTWSCCSCGYEHIGEKMPKICPFCSETDVFEQI